MLQICHFTCYGCILQYPPFISFSFVNHKIVVRCSRNGQETKSLFLLTIDYQLEGQEKKKKRNFFCIICYSLESQSLTLPQDQLSSFKELRFIIMQSSYIATIRWFSWKLQLWWRGSSLTLVAHMYTLLLYPMNPREGMLGSLSTTITTAGIFLMCFRRLKLQPHQSFDVGQKDNDNGRQLWCNQ